MDTSRDRDGVHGNAGYIARVLDVEPLDIARTSEELRQTLEAPVTRFSERVVSG